MGRKNQLTKRNFEPYELLVRPGPGRWEYGLDVTPLHTVITFDKKYNAKLMQRIMRPVALAGKIKEGG